MRTLQELREAAGLTAEQLATKLAVRAQLVIGWESGALAPESRHVGQLALALGATPEAVRAALPGRPGVATPA